MYLYGHFYKFKVKCLNTGTGEEEKASNVYSFKVINCQMSSTSPQLTDQLFCVTD